MRRRLFGLTRQDLLIITEAVIMAIPIEFWLRRLPLDALIARLGKVGRGHRSVRSPIDIERAARLVDALAMFYPLNPTCLKKSLVLFRILRKRGIAAELRLGVRKVQDRFAAHGWIECQGRVLLGGGMEHLYVTLPLASGAQGTVVLRTLLDDHSHP